MITIYCGENSVAARAAYRKAIEECKSTQSEIITLSPSSILDIYKGLANNLSLFAIKKIFCVENLEKFSFKKSTKAKKDSVYEALAKLAVDKSIHLLDFEDSKQARQLKLKDLAEVVESKPSTSIFKLNEECYPSNKNQFIESLHIVSQTQDEMFILIMLFRHIRLLILSAYEGASAKLPPWQKYKIIDQSKKWNKKTLLDFYSGLIKIEINAKTSSDPYGIAKSLEILACHYL